MQFNEIHKIHEGADITLVPIQAGNKAFISQLFEDNDIAHFYVIPKEAGTDHSKLIQYWLNDVAHGAGCCWIIQKKSSGWFSSAADVGFVAFEFRGSLTTGRISYAISPIHRNQGFATQAAGLVCRVLESAGLQMLEADVDERNKASVSVMNNLGFSYQANSAMIDMDMLNAGDFRFRRLWRKDLRAAVSIDSISKKMGLDATLADLRGEAQIIGDELESKGHLPQLIIRYAYLVGRIKFLEGELDEAQEAFAGSNMAAMGEGLEQNHENFFWFAKIKSARGESVANVNMYYEMAFERYQANPLYLTLAEMKASM